MREQLNMPEVLAELRAAVGDKHVHTAVEKRMVYSFDSTFQNHLPDVVVKPHSVEEAAAVVKTAGRYNIPLTVRGAGTCLSGGPVATEGGILMEMTAFKRILEVNAEEQYAVVEPGVVTNDLIAAAAKKGLFYPPDPSSSGMSTLGGNVAECAGGGRGVKYGVTRDYVLELEVILPDGEIITVGNKVDGLTGWLDLPMLFTGSEGTLGILTRMTVRLMPKPEAIQTALAQLALMGVDVKFDALEEGYTIVDPAYLPSVAVEVYMNVDEKGAQNGPTQVSVYVVPAGETNPATTVITKVNGNNVTVDAQFVSGKDNINVIYAMDRDPADPFGLNGRVDAYVNDLYFGLAAVTASNGQSITFDAYEYVLDTEKAVAEEHGSVVLDGALTMGVSDKATHITLADLTGDNADDVIGGLTSDLSGGALSIVMSIASTVPEIGALMGQLMGNANAPAA
jgi:FAD/FMN-containing dehydrogenase